MNPIVLGEFIKYNKIKIKCPFCGHYHIHNIPFEYLGDNDIGYRMSKCKNMYIKKSYYIIGV